MLIPFHAHRQLACFLELFVNFVAHSVALARIADRADDKEISEGCDFPKIENEQVVSFLRFGGMDGGKPITFRLFLRCGVLSPA